MSSEESTPDKGKALVDERKGVGTGLVLGIVFGIIFDNIALGIVFGLIFGAAYDKKQQGNAGTAD